MPMYSAYILSLWDRRDRLRFALGSQATGIKFMVRFRRGECFKGSLEIAALERAGPVIFQNSEKCYKVG